GPAVMEFWLSPTGRPEEVVMCGQDGCSGLSDGIWVRFNVSRFRRSAGWDTSGCGRRRLPEAMTHMAEKAAWKGGLQARLPAPRSGTFVHPAAGEERIHY